MKTLSIGLIAMLLSSCFLREFNSTQVLTAPLHNGIMGVTICDGHTPVIVVTFGMDSLSRKSVLEHELIHVKQIRRVGKCNEFSEKYRTDDVFRFDSELEAYCPEARRIVTKHGRERVMTNLSIHLTNQTQPSLSPEDIKLRVGKCLDSK